MASNFDVDAFLDAGAKKPAGFDVDSFLGTGPVTAKGKWAPSPDILQQPDTYWVPPKEYLKLLPPLEEGATEGPQGRSLKKSLDSGDQIDEAPSLTVRNGKIARWDGRHRAEVAMQEGVDLIPVKVDGEITADDAGVPVLPSYDGKSAVDWKYGTTKRPIGVPKTLGEVGRKWWEEGGLTAPFRGMVTAGKVITGDKPMSTAVNLDMTLKPDVEAALSLGAGAAPGNGIFGPRAIAPTQAATPAQAAISSGYALPPMMTDQPGVVSNMLSGWAGKIKTAQRASEKNEAVTTALATKALGLPEGTPLTEATFNAVRDEAGEAYKKVKLAVPKITLDDAFLNDVIKLGGARNDAAGEFSQLLKRPDIDALRDGLLEKTEYTPSAAIELVKQLRADAKVNFKNFLDPGKHALGQAQRDAADAVDSVIERNLEHAGQPDLVNDYRAARRRIAMAHDVEYATDTNTGTVSARALGRLAARGKPLSGNLRDIANVAQSFPKAVQDTARFGGTEPYSVLDAAAGAHAALTGNPGFAAVVLGRPAVREMILSRLYQNRLARGDAPSISPENPLRSLPLSAVPLMMAPGREAQQ